MNGLAQCGSVAHVMALAAACAAATIGWYAYLRTKVQNRRWPIWLGLAALFGGAASLFASLAWYECFTALGGVASWDALVTGRWASAVRLSAVIGFVEEGSKMLPVLFFVRRIERARDAVIFAALAGIGFGSAETVALFLGGELGMVDGLARAVAGPLTHAVFVAPLGLGLYALSQQRRLFPLVLASTASISSHALYDLMLARSDVFPRCAAAGIVLVLWLWMIQEVAVRPVIDTSESIDIAAGLLVMALSSAPAARSRPSRRPLRLFAVAVATRAHRIAL